MINKKPWRIALLPLLCAAGLLLASATKSLNQGYLVPSGKTRIDQKLLGKELKICALTFDDGPDIRFTMQVHDILREQGIRATFFVVGRNVDRYPEQVVALAEYGHEIGNHSWTHRDFLKLSKADIRKELQDTNAVLGKLGIQPRWFRPPYGNFNRTVIDLVAAEDMDTMLWSVDPQDWQRPGVAAIQRRVTGNAVPGSVILLHSTVSETVEALPGIIEQLRDEGYRFVTASEWQQLVSGSATLDTLQRGSDYSLPLGLPDVMPGSGTLGNSLPADSDVWQRVPAARPGDAPRKLIVYSNFVDDNDLRRVLSEERSRNMVEADSVIGGGLLRVLEGLPPQQIVAVVEEPGGRRDAGGSVEVSISELPVDNAELFADAARQAQQPPAGIATEPQGEQATQPAGPVAIASPGMFSANLQSADYASGIELAGGDIAFVSYASKPDATEWRWLEQYMRLCGCSGFGYASGFSPGRAPQDFPFSAAASQQGRQALVLSSFSPQRYIEDIASGEARYIPLRSNDFRQLDPASLYGGVSNGYREFMLIRRMTAGLSPVNGNGIADLPAGLTALRFSGRGQEVLLIASSSPGIELMLPADFTGWQQLSVDDRGRLEGRPATGMLREAGRLLVLLRDDDA